MNFEILSEAIYSYESERGFILHLSNIWCGIVLFVYKMGIKTTFTVPSVLQNKHI